MSRNVTVNLFDVSWTEETQPLSKTLNEYAALNLEKRIRDGIRLDFVEKISADNVLSVDVYHLGFAKSREIGPGKMGVDHPVEDVGLSPDEFFGEETAALYVPDKKWLLVLNNHYGVGPTRMARYFNLLDPGGDRYFFYTVAPKIDQAALKKMQGMKNFSEIEVVANVGAFESGDKLGESVYEATSQVSAQRLTLKLSANEAYKKGGFLNTQVVRDFVGGLLANSDGVAKLKVKSGDEAVARQDRFIDLIEQKIKMPFSDNELEIFNHRYTLASKINLLRKACRHWLRSLT